MQRFSLCWIVALLLVACTDEAITRAPAMSRLHTVLGAAEGWQRAEHVQRFEFPRDHGAHNAYKSEWWYLTSVLEAADGREFGVQFTVFRQGVAQPLGVVSPWGSGQAYMAHLAVTDVNGQTHESAMRFSRGHPDAVVIQADPFAIRVNDWSLVGLAHGPLDLNLSADGDASWGVRLALKQTTPPILQGDRGLSAKGADSASYYYSIARMATRGRLRIANDWVTVTGESWLDREWSTSVLGAHLNGWAWFALQLDDGLDLMAFKLRRADGTRDAYDYAMLRTPATPTATGSIEKFGPDEFTLTPRRFWQDTQGTRWPVAWDLSVDQRQWHVAALVDDQLLTSGFVYWEGLVGVYTPKGERVGAGYMELTGYRSSVQPAH